VLEDQRFRAHKLPYTRIPPALTLKRTPHSAHTVYLRVSYGSHNKQRLFPLTALTGWAL
jgi:hypothetical protein